MTSPPVVFVFCFYLLGFFILSEWARITWHRKLFSRWAAALVCVVCSAVVLGAYFNNGFLSADCVFVDVGQGACVHLRAPDGSDYLVDGGGKVTFGQNKDDSRSGFDVGEDVLAPYLLKNGVRKVDIAFVTHTDADHYRGIVSICRMGMVEKLGLHTSLKNEEAEILSETGMRAEDIVYVNAGNVLSCEGFRMEIAGPVSEGGSDNENSLVIRAIYENNKSDRGVSILITGDIDEQTEKELCSHYSGSELDSDIVQVPHHGSRYSSSQELINAASPLAAVIQVGKNTYGHPSEEVIERYEQYGCQVFRNDMQGAVGVFGRKIRTMRFK